MLDFPRDLASFRGSERDAGTGTAHHDSNLKKALQELCHLSPCDIRNAPGMPVLEFPRDLGVLVGCGRYSTLNEELRTVT